MLIYACQSKYLHHFIEQSRLPALARLAGGKGRLARALGEQGMHQSTFAIDADDAKYLDSPRNRYVHAAQIRRLVRLDRNPATRGWRWGLQEP